MKKSLAALLLPALSSGCFIYDTEYDNVASAPPGAVYATIDADHTLSTELGEGAAVFIEYQSGGVWRAWTSCDTNLTGYGCAFDVHFSSQSVIETVSTAGLEAEDFVEESGANISFYATTYGSSDSIELRTAPGALMTVELVLDGQLAPRYLVWYGNGLVRDGANGSPVVFQPDLP